MNRKHRIVRVEVIKRESELNKLFSDFCALYEKGKLDAASKALDKLFLYSYENDNVLLYEILSYEAALKGENGEVLKAIRLNRVLLDTLRRKSTVSEVEKAVSENLIKDLSAFGYSVGALTEERKMSERVYLSFIQTHSSEM